MRELVKPHVVTTKAKADTYVYACSAHRELMNTADNFTSP